MRELRAYQRDAVESCLPLLERGVCLVLPTGAGKTVCAVEIMRRAAKRALFVVHRREIVLQAKDALEEAGARVGVILAGEEPDRSAPFQVASIQTLARREMPAADLLVVDEAHHATSDSYAKLVVAFPRRLYLTATPFRLDGKGLRTAGVNEIVVGAYTDDLCADGTLHEPAVFAGPAPDVSGVKKTAGDYNVGALGAAVRRANLEGRVVATWLKRAQGRRTVVFAVDVSHAEQLVMQFRAANVSAEIVTGTTPKATRAGVLARLAAGLTTVVVNVGVLTEGWDLPALEVAVIARPTASRCLHLQMLGRVMRACQGKDGALVLDHAGNSHRHGLVTERLRYDLDTRVKAERGEAPCKECPSCGRVLAAGTMTCPECAHVFVRENKTEESDAELLPIGHGDDFATRAHRWHSMLVGAIRIVRQQAGELFGEDQGHKAYAIASARFKARYGEYPLSIEGRLIEASRATPAEWAALRLKWRRIGERKQWTPSKIAWFIQQCEAKARGVARTDLARIPREKCRGVRGAPCPNEAALSGEQCNNCKSKETRDLGFHTIGERARESRAS